MILSDTLRRHRAKLDSLTSENKLLVRDLSILQSVPRDVEYRLGQKRIEAAREEGRHLSQRVHDLMQISNDLDGSIETLRNHLHSTKKTRDRLRGSSENQAVVLEKRLNQAVVNFNQVLGSNQVLRENVDNLRQEKQSFSRIEKRLLADIEKENIVLTEVIEKINSSYTAKDKAVSDLQHLRTIADREHFEFEREWKELSRLLEKDSENLFSHKSLERVVASDSSNKNAEVFEDVVPEVKANENENEEELVSGEIEISKFESIFRRIKESVGMSSIEELLDFFTKKELLNYSLFNRSNTLSSEIERKEFCIKNVSNDLKNCLKSENFENLTILPKNRNFSQDAYLQAHKRVSRIRSSLLGIKRVLDKETPFSDCSDIDDICDILSDIDSMLDRPLSIRPSSSVRSHTGGLVVHPISLPSSIALGEDLELRPLWRSEIERTTFNKLKRSQSASSTRPTTSSSTSLHHRVKNPT